MADKAMYVHIIVTNAIHTQECGLGSARVNRQPRWLRQRAQEAMVQAYPGNQLSCTVGAPCSSTQRGVWSLRTVIV